ncbi:glycosyltransferase [Pseudoalteromonas fenneropenaei]|uniref:Glycosyltransferase n=1 Tax=Pseudoalteromonas fenneropenaei TaxID=1737459 RepID=A0ABV7CKF9_9GAMM
MSPLVTVWLPTYNRLHLLKRAVDSVLAQTYKNIELFIVDNGSKDGTQEFIRDLMLRHPNIRYKRFDENRGACNARNYAILNGEGLYATGLDDDDEFLPNRIQSLLEAFDKQDAFVCSGYYWDYGSRRKAILSSQLSIGINEQLNFNQASNQVFTFRNRLIESGLFDPDLVSSQDWDMWTRLILKYGNGKRIATVSYIVHTAHDLPRITSSEDARVRGLEQFFSKYEMYMSEQNKKCFSFFMHYTQGKCVTLMDVKRFYCKPIAVKVIKAWLASLFPYLARKRLEILK